jgi:hypothetical protein
MRALPINRCIIGSLALGMAAAAGCAHGAVMLGDGTGGGALKLAVGWSLAGDPAPTGTLTPQNGHAGGSDPFSGVGESPDPDELTAFASNVFSRGDFGSVDLSVPVIPEPAAWILMILGFGMAGGLLRRRRTAASA